jgi:DNA polymerase III subunit delta'
LIENCKLKIVNFVEFIGNKKAINLLKRSIENSNIAQAYLFCGPEAVGKFKLAKNFFKALINSNTTILRNMEVEEKKNQILDLMIVEPEKETKKGVTKEKDIKIEQIREAQNFLLSYPMQGKYKILIINDAQRMTISAQNSLLKILEEPNNTSIIILITSDLEKILPTLRSRSQKINFNLVRPEEMEKNDINGEIAALSMGRPGLAKMLSSDQEKLKEWKGEADVLKKIFNLDINGRLNLAEKMSKNTSNTVKKLELWIWILRNEKDNAEKYKAIGLIDQAISELTSTNASGRLILENLLLNIS